MILYDHQVGEGKKRNFIVPRTNVVGTLHGFQDF